MEWIGQFVLVLLLKQVSPAIVSTNLTTGAPATSTLKNEELKTSSTYAVREDIIDIPDNRTLLPILANFTFTRPLNLGNNTLITNNNANNSEEKGDENNNNHVDGKLKKNSFSILHIKGEFESHKPEKEHKHRNVLSKLFGDLKEHVYSWKRGVVGGLHSFFHRHDDDDNNDDRYKPFKPVKEWYPNHHHHHKFHRKFDDAEDFDHHSDYYDDDYNDSSEEHYGHF